MATIVIGLILFVLLARAAVRKYAMRLDRNIVFAQGLIIISIVCSTIHYYISSPSSMTPLFYAIGLIANMIVQNNIVARLKGDIVNISLKSIFFLMFLSVFFFPSYDLDGNLASIYGSGNGLGIMLCFSVYILFLCWGRMGYFVALFCILIIYLIHMTGSRTALLFFVSFMILYFVRNNRIIFYSAVASIILFLAFYLYKVFPGESFYPELMFGTKELFKISGRSTIWTYSAHEILKAPLGIGLGLSHITLVPMTGQSAPHNAILKMALEGGWLFAVSYIILFISMLKHSKLQLTKIFLISYNLKVIFELATPFGLSLTSSLITLPYFLEKVYENTRKDIDSTATRDR